MVYSKVARSAVVALLREHLRRNIVRIGKQWHYQSNGIPQVGHGPFTTIIHPDQCSAYWTLPSDADLSLTRHKVPGMLCAMLRFALS